MPAVVLEPHMPPLREVIPSLQFGIASYTHRMQKHAVEGDSWALLGQQYSLLTRNFLCDKKTGLALMRKAEELAKDRETDREKVESLYEFMQSEIRYVAIDLDESGIIPHVPSDVFDKRYGDCKDQAFLFITMLAEAGIEAYPVLVRSRQTGEIIEDFVSFGQFNHMAVGVPAECLGDHADVDAAAIPYLDPTGTRRAVLLLDTTSGSIPCWRVPWYLEGTKALVVQESGGTLVTVPVTTEQANRALFQSVLASEGRSVTLEK